MGLFTGNALRKPEPTLVKRLFLNGVLATSALLIFFILLEFVVFRFFLVASDLPHLAKNSSGILKYAAKQTGTYRLHNEIFAKFNINEEGWNSHHDVYQLVKDQGVFRICMVGDSYIEALQVNYDASVAELLENRLKDSGRQVEVYRFGISGAPLSHYLYMIDNEILKYQPDLIIVNLVHNDFGESITPAFGTYSDSFSTLVTNTDGLKRLSSPKPYRRKPSWWLKQSATFRYLWVRMQIRPDLLKRIWMKIFQVQLPPNEPTYAANIQVEQSQDSKIKSVLDFSFESLQRIEQDTKTRVLLVIDGDRSEIVSAIDENREVVSAVDPLNSLVSIVAKKYKLGLVDLTTAFYEDYLLTRTPLRFMNDGHWNQHAHSVVARAIAIELSKRELFD